MPNQSKEIIDDFEQILLLIQEARNDAFTRINTALILLYFRVGEIVSEKVSAEIWGQSTVDKLADYINQRSPELTGFNRRGLYRMKQFFETYSENSDFLKVWQENYLKTTHSQFVSSVLTQITWTNHLLILSKTKTAEEKMYYLLTSVQEKYSSRELEGALNTAQFERTMLSSKIVSAVQTQLPQHFFKDPYIFEFLDLPDNYSGGVLEKALILNLQQFILEIGKGFAYMGNQYRLQVGNNDYYTDLIRNKTD